MILQEERETSKQKEQQRFECSVRPDNPLGHHTESHLSDLVRDRASAVNDVVNRVNHRRHERIRSSVTGRRLELDASQVDEAAAERGLDLVLPQAAVGLELEALPRDLLALPVLAGGRDRAGEREADGAVLEPGGAAEVEGAEDEVVDGAVLVVDGHGGLALKDGGGVAWGDCALVKGEGKLRRWGAALIA